MSMHVHYERKFILVLHQESWKVFFELEIGYYICQFSYLEYLLSTYPTNFKVADCGVTSAHHVS